MSMRAHELSKATCSYRQDGPRMKVQTYRTLSDTSVRCILLCWWFVSDTVLWPCGHDGVVDRSGSLMSVQRDAMRVNRRSEERGRPSRICRDIRAPSANASTCHAILYGRRTSSRSTPTASRRQLNSSTAQQLNSLTHTVTTTNHPPSQRPRWIL